MKKNIVLLFLLTQIFAIAGIGVYGNYDPISRTPQSSTKDEVAIIPGSTTDYGNLGLGLFVYVDVLPIIDLEVAAEIAGTYYPVTIDLPLVGSETYEGFPWVRFSAYGTIRKKIIGVSIPFLAKVQLHGGAGANYHSITPDITVQFMQDALTTPDNTTFTADQVVNRDFSDTEEICAIFEYMREHMRTVMGGHIQLGIQGKLLMINMFINGRYTLAKNVIPDQAGFASVWVGLSYGF